MLEVFFYFHPERNSVGVSVVECFVEVFLIRLSGFWCGEVRPPPVGRWLGFGRGIEPIPLVFVLVVVGEAKLSPLSLFVGLPVNNYDISTLLCVFRGI